MAKAIGFAALAIGAVALIATGVGAVALGGFAGTLTVGGISASTLFLVSGGLSVASTLLAKTPKVTASQTERLTASVDPRAYRKTWFGQTAGAVDIRYEEWSGKDQEICDWIIAFASHAIDGVEEIWFDTQMAWSARTGVVGKYVGYFSIPNLVLEGTPQNAFTFASGKWNANTARMTGCAYARFRFKVTGNSKKAQSPFSSGIPSRITVIGRGAKLYDPRRDSTVPGGSGPMRASDQSTWRYTADDGVVIGENLPLQILRVVLGWRIRNPVTGVMKLATGSGVPARRISLPSFQIAANLADELVNRSAGGNEPRYHGAGVISEGDDQKTVLDMMCAGCCARFRDTAGKLALVVSHNDLASAAIDDGLDDDDVVGAFNWDPDPSLEATPNIVRGKYVDPTTASLYQLVDYPEVSLPSPDGQDRYLSLDLGVVESPSHAQRVAKQVLQRRQYSRQFSAAFDIRAWKYNVGDVLPFTFAPLGFARTLFRVKEQELGQGGTCNMVLTFETPDFYQWDASDALPVQAADPIVYDSRNNPLILAIDEAATTAQWDAVSDPNGTKPADNADVTGENTSKDTNAVGGKPASDLLKSLDELETVTIPAVNKAVADANIAIDAARREADAAVDAANTKIDQATAALAEDDAAIVRQIETIATDFNDRDVATNVRVDEKVALLAGADKALGEKVDRIVAGGSYDDTAVRAEISRVDTTAIDRDSATGRRIDEVKASFSAGGNLLSNTDFISNDGWTFNSGAGSIGALNGVTGPQWWPVGMNALVIGQENASTDRAGFWQQTIAGIEPGQIYQFSVYAGSHRCVTTLYLDWLSSSGEFIGTRSIDTVEGNPGNGLLTDYHRMFFNEPAPAGAARARIYLIKQGTRAGENSYAWFLRPQGAKVGSADAALLPYTPGSGDAVQISSAAKIDQAATSAADANRSVADLSRSVTATFEGVERTFGGYNERITALSDAQDSYASRASALEAQASPSGGNLVPNSSLSTLDGWSLTANPGALSSLVLNGAGSAWMIGGVENNLTLYRGPAGPGLFSEVQSSPFAVRAGSTIQLYAMAACHRCRAWVSVFFFNDNGFIGYAGENSAARINAGGQDLNAWDQTGVKEIVVPPGAVRATIALRSYDVENDGYAWFSRPFVTEVKPGTKTWVPYSSGNDRAVTGATSARISDIASVVADLPNRYAAASRTAALEAQVNFGADSGLQRTVNARIEDRATAIADAKAGAVAQTLAQLRAEYNGSAATIAEQTGAIAGIDGRTSVFWSVTGTTPDGSTRISLSKSDGSAGVFYIGANLFVDGNAIFNGTVTIRALDRSTMTATTASSVAGSYGGAGQASKQYIPNLGADMFIRSGGSIYIALSGFIGGQTNGTRDTQPTFEILNAADNGILATVPLPESGFGSTGRLDNYTIRVLNTFGELTIRWRVAVRATERTWSIIRDPALSVYWTAL